MRYIPANGKLTRKLGFWWIKYRFMPVGSIVFGVVEEIAFIHKNKIKFFCGAEYKIEDFEARAYVIAFQRILKPLELGENKTKWRKKNHEQQG